MTLHLQSTCELLNMTPLVEWAANRIAVAILGGAFMISVMIGLLPVQAAMLRADKSDDKEVPDVV